MDACREARIAGVLLGMLYGAALLLTGCGGSGGGTGGGAGPSATYSISGTVLTGGGVAASGVTITLSGGAAGQASTATTDPGGNYTFAGLAGNYTYTVTPSEAGFAFSPSNRSVAIGTSSVTAQNFTSAAVGNPVTISGAVSGAWVDRVKITIGGGASPVVVYTNSSGQYSSPTLAGGLTYTITPSLPGYSFTVTGGTGTFLSTGASTSTANFTAASAIASTSLSGTVSYGGARSGRVYLKPAQWGLAGTSIALTGTPGAYSPTAYQIRGIQPPCSTCYPVSYTVDAFMDTLGTGINNAVDPQGSASVTFTGPGALTVNIALTDPANGAPGPATIGKISPVDSGVVVNVNPVFSVLNGSSVEAATGYLLEWAADAAFATNHGSAVVKAHGCNCPYFMGGLSNGTAYYFRVTAQVSSGGVTTSSAPSGAYGPITVGPATGASALSGTVTFTGPATGPLYIVVRSNDTFYGVRYANPVSGMSYSIPGLSGGSYKPIAFVDMNNDGLIDTGDMEAGNNAPTFTSVTGNTILNIALPAGNAVASVLTTHGTNISSGVPWYWYSTDTNIVSGAKMPVSAIVYSAPNAAVPFDLTTSVYGSGGVMDGLQNMGLTPPAVGDAYQVLVTYADGSTEYLNASVNAVLDSFAQTPSPSGTNTNGGASVPNPVFSWAAPLAPPAAYAYAMAIQQASGVGGILYSTNGTMPSSTTSVTATGLTLTGGTTYRWWINVLDSSGNMATLMTTDTP